MMQSVGWPINPLLIMNPQIEQIQDLLGPCVLLPCKGKRPLAKAWQKLTLADMTPSHLAKVDSASNVGVSLGEASQGLISIDFDTEAGLTAFLRLNPQLASTMRTKGARGANLWLRCIGLIPKSQLLVDANGEEAGELRSTRNQTIIHGLHPDTGQPYVIQVQAPPMEIEFLHLKWCPEAHPRSQPIVPPSPCDTECEEHTGLEEPTDAHRNGQKQIDSTSSLCASSALYHNDKTAKAAAALQAEREFEKQGERVVRLYERLVSRRYVAHKCQRNDFITLAIPFLYRALSRNRALEFSLHFYRQNQVIFKDSLHQHELETQAMLDGVAQTYRQHLPERERELYDRMKPREQDAFRICKDLAMNNSNEAFPPPLFFVSCQDMADRVGVSCEQGRRLLHRLISLGVIAEDRPGSSHTAGKRGVATTYRWL